MSLVSKVYLTLFLAFVFIFTCIGIVTADQDISNARDFKQEIIKQLEESNLSDQVIAACKTNAEAHGYILDTKTLKDDRNRSICVEITLHYNYTIRFLNIIKEHTLHDYAR